MTEGAKAAVGEIVLRSQWITLALDPGFRVGIVLERRRAAVDGNYVRPGPRACCRVGIGTVALRVWATLPCSQHVSDLVGERCEEGALPGRLKMLSIDFNRIRNEVPRNRRALERQSCLPSRRPPQEGLRP